jgi:hypothetical protein
VITKTKWVAWSVGILILSMVVSFKLDWLQAAFDKNLGYVSLSRALASDHIQATDRQVKLARFLAYLDSAGELDVPLSLVKQSNETSMLRSIFIGDYYRLRGDLNKAARWYLLAAHSEPFPSMQNSLLYAQRTRLLPDGDILIADFTNVDAWVPCWDNNNDDAALESDNNTALISYPNNLEQRDFVAYLLYPEGGLQLGYHTVLSMRVRVETGSFLTVEVTVDDVAWQRVLHYYRGTGDWETLRFPLTGDVLKMVELSVSEPEERLGRVRYSVWIDWIQLELGSE